MALSQRFEDALVFCSMRHAGQRRKGTCVPYISHPLAVASLALEHGADEDEAIATLLHDAVEDHGGQDALDAIRVRFGNGVAAIVAGCTDSIEDPKPAWRERKEGYLAHLSHAPESVLLVSAADKLHNARAIASDYRLLGEQLWQRFGAGKEVAVWYYPALVSTYKDAVRSGRVLPLIRELARTVEELHAMIRTGEVGRSSPMTAHDNRQEDHHLRRQTVHAKSIRIRVTPSFLEHNLITVHRSHRSLFPGYEVPFVVETDAMTIGAKVTSAPMGTPYNDPRAGNYIKSVERGDLEQWFRRHPEVKVGDYLLIEIIEPMVRYRLLVG